MLLRSLSLILTVCILGGVSGGCKEDPPASLYDPNYVLGPTPIIATIAPPESSIAAVSVVTITGTNFSTRAQNNLVFFDSQPVEVVEASATQLRVKAPDYVKDTIQVKVAVIGSELFSEPVRYKLIPAVSDFGFIPFVLEEPFGIECDVSGNIYSSQLSGEGFGLGVRKFFRDGRRDTSFVAPPPSSSLNKWTAMKFGPGGFMYTAVNRNAMYRFPATGGSATPWTLVGPGGTAIYDFDFDQQQNIWASGTNVALYRIRQDRNVKAFPFTGTSDVSSVRVFNNHVYVSGKIAPDSAKYRVVRFQIVSGDSLGPAQNYFAFSGADSGAGIYAITFASDGDMFVATDGRAGTVVLVHPNGSYEKFYPGLFKAKGLTFAYGQDNELYMSRTGLFITDKRIVRIRTQKAAAPQYGRP